MWRKIIMKVLSLFDGISCLRIALGDRPVEYFASEIDPHAMKISKKNYPDIKQLGNVCDISGITGVDLLVGGSPCTDLSIAKKDRKGLEGDHSKLFWQFVRVLRDSKPKYFILENVASMPKKDRDIITKELGVEPIMIDAALVSAQTRKRYFWTNIPNVKLPEDRNIMLKDILELEVEAKPQTGKLTVIEKRPHGFHQIGYFGDKNASNVGGQALRVYSIEGKSTTSGVGLYAVKGVSIRGRLKGSKYVNQIDVRKDEKTSALTSTCAGKLALVGRMKDDKELDKNSIRRLTPIECERLMGLPDNYTEGISKSQRHKCIGNAFSVPVMKHILSFME